jgi:hypothetical protein
VFISQVASGFALAMTMAARKEKKEQAAIGFANRCLFLPYISANVVIARAKPEATPFSHRHCEFINTLI